MNANNTHNIHHCNSKASQTVGRFAPSPSGRMHLGNMMSALLSWLSAKSAGGKWILRIEDLDPQRSKLDYAKQIEDDLDWLGLTWDEGGLDGIGPHGPYCQSLRHDIYRLYLDKLEATGMTYPCYCTRADIMATQAPHASDGRVIYGGKCRPATLPDFRPAPTDRHATRIAVDNRSVSFTDIICGVQNISLAKECGDFVLQRADGAWAYQLAVVIDDALMGVTEVIRGNDLLTSTAGQLYLYDILGLSAPQFGHIPLVCNAKGQRLSKRDGATSLEYLRPRMTAEEIIGYVAELAGLNPTGEPISASNLIEMFSWENVRKSPTLVIDASRIP